MRHLEQLVISEQELKQGVRDILKEISTRKIEWEIEDSSHVIKLTFKKASIVCTAASMGLSFPVFNIDYKKDSQIDSDLIIRIIDLLKKFLLTYVMKDGYEAVLFVRGESSHTYNSPPKMLLNKDSLSKEHLSGYATLQSYVYLDSVIGEKEQQRFNQYFEAIKELKKVMTDNPFLRFPFFGPKKGFIELYGHSLIIQHEMERYTVQFTDDFKHLIFKDSESNIVQVEATYEKINEQLHQYSQENEVKYILYPPMHNFEQIMNKIAKTQENMLQDSFRDLVSQSGSWQEVEKFCMGAEFEKLFTTIFKKNDHTINVFLISPATDIVENLKFQFLYVIEIGDGYGDVLEIKPVFSNQKNPIELQKEVLKYTFENETIQK